MGLIFLEVHLSLQRTRNQFLGAHCSERMRDGRRRKRRGEKRDWRGKREREREERGRRGGGGGRGGKGERGKWEGLLLMNHHRSPSTEPTKR